MGALQQLVILAAFAAFLVAIGGLWVLYGMRNERYCRRCNLKQPHATKFCCECGSPLKP
jgi:hypothetical protein